MHKFLGIDIGKKTIVIAYPPEREREYLDWPTIAIDMRSPDWWRHLIALIDDHAIVTAESTGHHLLSPIANVIKTYRPTTHLYQVEGRTTKNYRERFARAKTDPIDAIALCTIAIDCARHTADPRRKLPRGVSAHSQKAEAQLFHLRTTVNRVMRTEKELTRQTNRLRQYAYSITPSLSFRLGTYLHFVRAGHATPDAIAAIVHDPTALKAFKAGLKAQGLDGRVLNRAAQLVADLPQIPIDQAVIDAIITTTHQRDEAKIAHAAALADLAAALDHPDFSTTARRWRTVPCWNNTAIGAFIVACSNTLDSINQDDFSAALGVNAVSHQSGDRDSTGKIIRKGYSPARRYSYMWAFTMTAHPGNQIYDYYHAHGGLGHCSIWQLRNKLARILWGKARDASLDTAIPAASADQTPDD